MYAQLRIATALASLLKDYQVSTLLSTIHNTHKRDNVATTIEISKHCTMNDV